MEIRIRVNSIDIGFWALRGRFRTDTCGATQKDESKRMRFEQNRVKGVKKEREKKEIKRKLTKKRVCRKVERSINEWSVQVRGVAKTK